MYGSLACVRARVCVSCVCARACDVRIFLAPYRSYLLSAFGLLLVVSQSFGTKLLLCFLSEDVTIAVGMFTLATGLTLQCVCGQMPAPFLFGLVLSGLAYVVVPSLNGFVSKKTPVGDQGTVLAILASVRSLSLGLGQLGGGVVLVLFTSSSPPFALPGFHFLVAGAFAVCGAGCMVYVCLFMRRQARSKAIFEEANNKGITSPVLTAATRDALDGDAEADAAAAAAEAAEPEARGDDEETEWGSAGAMRSRYSQRERTTSRGGLLVREIWGTSNSMSLDELRPHSLSTIDATRRNRPAALSTGATIPGVR